MKYRRVGRGELEVSVIGLGGWRTLGDKLTEQESLALLDAALSAGINLFDLANVYAGGAAEAVVGRWLQRQSRDRVIVTSKVFWPMGPSPDDRGLGRRHIFAAVDATLRRLQTDYVDLYFCHREDPKTPLLETITAMSDLVREGKIRHWGTSMWRPKTLVRAQLIARSHRLVPPIAEQPSYNLLERWVERFVVPTCRVSGMGIFPYSPLAEGLLTGKYSGSVPAGSRASEVAFLKAQLDGAKGAAARQFARIASDMGVPPSALALAWLLQRPGVTSVLMGASSVLQLHQNLAAATLEIPVTVTKQLDAISVAR